jgi:hypothetical protein
MAVGELANAIASLVRWTMALRYATHLDLGEVNRERLHRKFLAAMFHVKHCRYLFVFER